MFLRQCPGAPLTHLHARGELRRLDAPVRAPDRSAPHAARVRLRPGRRGPARADCKSAARRRARSSRRRLRAPKDRQPQGPSRGRCRRRSRRRVRLRDAHQPQRERMDARHRARRPDAVRGDPIEHGAWARRCARRRATAGAHAASAHRCRSRPPPAVARNSSPRDRRIERRHHRPPGRRPAPTEIDQSSRPAMKARVPSIGSTTQTRSRVEPRRVVLAFLRQPAVAGAQQPLAQQIVRRDVGFGDRRIAACPWSSF